MSKIIAFQAENIKRLVVASITPKGNVVQITGKNGQGKTSVLDCIWWALGGAKDIQKNPIRDGQDTGQITLHLDDMIVSRFFKRVKDGDFTTSLQVTGKDGVRFSSPQAVLDKLIGNLSFDPLAFARATPAEQFNLLRTFVPGVDFKAIETANKADFDKRTDVNRQAKQARSAAASWSDIVSDGEEIDEAELIAQLRQAGERNADVDLRMSNRKNMQRDIDTALAAAAKLTAEAKALQEKLINAPALPTRIDVKHLEVRIANARQHNADLAKVKDRQRNMDEAIRLEKISQELSDNISQRERDKLKTIAAAKLPVPSLSFGENEVLLDGQPFNQGSDAEQLRASVAIAMALNPTLRVIRVRDGSLLDNEGMELLAKLADANDCQVWIERVDNTNKVGFVLVDGHVEEPAAAEPEID